VNHLSSKPIAQLTAQLQSHRQAVLDAIRQRLHQGDAPADMALANQFTAVREQAEADLLADTDIGQLQLELAELDDIERALARIADGRYGRCASCGEAIALARLQAQPAASMCLACQQRHEQHRPPLPSR
jgi:DnaK suppressor protein